MRSLALTKAIREELDRISVVDSHEHIESGEFARSRDNQIFRVFARSVIEHDLSNTGVTGPRWKATVYGDREGWLSLKRYAGLCRNTGYFRAFRRATEEGVG